jgi:hypothetical protein
MFKFRVLLLLIALFTVIAFPVAAQEGDATEEPTAEIDAMQATAEVGATEEAPQQTQVATVRLAHFAPDAPVLVPYVNGQPSSIQDLAYPSLSGWVEIPTGSTISLIPQGAAQSEAVVGPLTISGADNWTTIVVVGSATSGTLSAYAVRENMGAIPNGCATVTVFHAIEGGPAVDVVTEDGMTLISGIGFPGSGLGNAMGGMDMGAESIATDEAGMAMTEEAGMEGDMAGGDMMSDPCASEMMGGDMDADMMATEEAGMMMTEEADMMGTEEAGMMAGNIGMMTVSSGALDCINIPMNMGMGGDMMAESAETEEADMGAEGAATEEMDMAATEEAGMDSGMAMDGAMIGSGGTSGSCGFILVVPAGSYNLQVVPTGGGDALLNLSGTQIEAGNNYFVAAVGTPDAPQVFVLSTAGTMMQ